MCQGTNRSERGVTLRAGAVCWEDPESPNIRICSYGGAIPVPKEEGSALSGVGYGNARAERDGYAPELVPCQTQLPQHLNQAAT